jgi:hypothetical protein
MGRGIILGFCLLAFACGDDKAVTIETNPVQVETCPCRLTTAFDNLAVCVSATGAFGPAQVYSSYVRPGASGPECGVRQQTPTAPILPWTSLTVRSACTGTGQFCVTIRGGDYNNPSVADCTLATRCSSIAYGTPNIDAQLEPLASWVAESNDCATRYEQMGGYLEFVVESDQLGCNMGEAQQKRVPLCPVRCRDNPMGEGCDVCGAPQVSTTF